MKKGHMSEEVYLEKLGALFEKLKAETPNASEEDIFITYREREFDLMINFRLGEDFPEERRQDLKKLHNRLTGEMNELRLKVSSREISADNYADNVQQLVKKMADDFRALLNEEEMKDLFDGEILGIPIDPGQIGHS